MTLRIGIDLGGTKTEIVALDARGVVRLRRRAATPADYPGIVSAITGLVGTVEAELGGRGSIGLGIPGSLSPRDGRVRNANTQCLNGQALDRDLAEALDRPVRISNDANCLALSEAADGAGAGHRVVFAVILGTGVGGGVVVDGKLLEGPNRVAGEWGHTPLPWMTPAEHPGRRCWCGLSGCLETLLCGPALAADWKGEGQRDAAGIEAAAAAGDPAAEAALERYTSRLARALAATTNLLDPDAVVLGGGLSNLERIYAEVPRRMAPFIFGDATGVRLLRARHGDSSGVFGAARLWDHG
ncbi:ROK family protein [Teichococcus vastitatis]|uniref:ROK family protein n=1 Tax=Teichococcus vastitatis TaxID=2307076 RepID=UPI000E7115FF|nr:ROK family protein [Pseudoroseomonas vastitatis]